MANTKRTLPSFLDHSDDIYICIAANGTILDFNKQASQIFSWQRRQHIKKNLFALHHDKAINSKLMHELKQQQAKSLKIDNQALATKKQHYIIDWVLQKNGTKNDLTQIILIGKNIREQKSQPTISTEEILSNLPGIAFWKDKQGRYLGCTKFAAKLFGRTTYQDVIGKTDLQLIRNKKEAQQIRRNDRQTISANKIQTFEEAFTTSKGTTKTYLTAKVPLYQQKQLIGIMGFATDITDRNFNYEILESISRQITGKSISKDEPIEEQIKWINIFLENIITNMPGNVYWKNTDSVYMGCNNQVVEVCNLNSRADIFGYTDFDFEKKLGWQPGLAKRFQEDDKRVFETNSSIIFEDEFRQADDTVVTMLTTKTPIRDNKGNIVGLLAVSADITERKKNEEELRIAKEKAEIANQAKSNFLAVMSHELRTPLNAILGMAQILRNQHLNNEQNSNIDIILRAGNHLLTLINDVLDFSKLEAGRLELNYEKFDLYQTVTDISRSVQPLLDKKDLKLISKYSDNAPHQLVADSRRVRQIITNLLGNAIKFANKGVIKLTVSSDKKGKQVKLSVEDNGIGIPKNKINQIFERFTQVDSKYSRKFEGTGLGLAICKQLVESMDGKIGANSKYHQGSKFWFTLPLNLKPSAKPRLTKPKAKKTTGEKTLIKCNLLLIEDNILNQKVAKAMLDELGCKVDIVDNGKEGIKQFQKKPYDIILSDIGLPDMSGIEVIKNIRSLETESQHIPIIALTAHVLEEDKVNCIQAGADEVLTKPIMQPELQDVLIRWSK